MIFSSLWDYSVLLLFILFFCLHIICSHIIMIFNNFSILSFFIALQYQKLNLNIILQFLIKYQLPNKFYVYLNIPFIEISKCLQLLFIL